MLLLDGSLASAAKSSLAVRGSAPFLGGAKTVLAEQPAERLPAERNTFDLAKLLTEMMIVKTDIAGACEMQDTIPHTRRKATRTRPTATRCNSFWLTANVSLFMG